MWRVLVLIVGFVVGPRVQPMNDGRLSSVSEGIPRLLVCIVKVMPHGARQTRT